MNQAAASAPAGQVFQLPATVVSRSDISRLLRALEMIENTLGAEKIRGQQMRLPKSSSVLAQVAEANSYDLLKEGHRKELVARLRQLRSDSPVFHITFAEEPHPDVVEQIVAWVRSNLHQYALVRVGLRSSLLAGCEVRTPSHVYKFGILAFFNSKKDLLRKRIPFAKV